MNTISNVLFKTLVQQDGTYSDRIDDITTTQPTPKPNANAALDYSNICYGIQSDMTNIRFLLDIETTKTTPIPKNGLMNRFEDSDSKIISINSTEIELWNEKFQYFDILSHDGLNKAGYYGNQITFHHCSRTEDTIIADNQKTYRNNKGFFTIEELVENIVDFEKLDRASTKWFGGIDCHHTYYEGIYPNKEKTMVQIDLNNDILIPVTSYYISWGS